MCDTCHVELIKRVREHRSSNIQYGWIEKLSPKCPPRECDTREVLVVIIQCIGKRFRNEAIQPGECSCVIGEVLVDGCLAY